MGIAARRSRHQAEGHAAHWARPQTGTLTYVALGDSAGVGVGVEDPHHGYVGIIADRLAEARGQEVRVVNLSVSGARVHDVLEHQVSQLSDIDAPDVLTCVIGGNDVAWAPKFRASDFAAAMRAIAAGLPVGSVMASVPHFLHWPYTARARSANDAIGAAAEAAGHAFADLHAATSRLSLSGYLRTFAGDRFHPNASGHALWADAIWEHLAP